MTAQSVALVALLMLWPSASWKTDAEGIPNFLELLALKRFQNRISGDNLRKAQRPHVIGDVPELLLVRSMVVFASVWFHLCIARKVTQLMASSAGSNCCLAAASWELHGA